MIIVTGGTGLVGSHLLWHLLKKGKQIRATHRKDSDLNNVLMVFEGYDSSKTAQKLFNQINWIEADILNIPELARAFKGVKRVYHCAGLVSYDLRDEKKLRKINIEGTANIVNLCLSFNIEKLCHVSSIAAIGTTLNNTPIDEETIWNAEKTHSGYAWSKYGAEMEVWRGSQEGLDAVIVNPGVIIGSGFWNSGSGEIYTRVNTNFPWKLKFTTGFVDVVDVVIPMIKLMETDIKNERFILVSENPRFEEVQVQIAHALGVKPPKRSVKKWLLFLAWLGQSIGRLFFKTSQTISLDTVKGYTRTSIYTSEKIKDTLDYQFRPLKMTLLNTAEHFIAASSNYRP